MVLTLTRMCIDRGFSGGGGLRKLDIIDIVAFCDAQMQRHFAMVGVGRHPTSRGTTRENNSLGRDTLETVETQRGKGHVSHKGHALEP